MLAHPVGGFFELHAPVRSARSVSALWRLDARPTIMFGNARSALAALLAQRRARRVWLPAYLCESVLEGASAAARSIEFYGLDGELEPDVDSLAAQLRRGDHVLAVDYFGRPPSRRFRRLVAARRDVHWIEDRAQALHTGAPAWGASLLFSPRKLLGVPDGGILVGSALLRGAQAKLEPPRIARMLTAQALHLFPAYQRSEAEQRVSRASMSELSRALLDATDAARMIRRRAANWRILHSRLRGVAAFAGAPGAAPFGYVVRVRDAARAQEQLIARAIYAQRHWARLPSPWRRFPDAHRLARELVTLPCDHRYGEREMREVARLARECLR